MSLKSWKSREMDCESTQMPPSAEMCVHLRMTCSLEDQWWSKDTVAVVTGANKGIGLQLVREFAKRGITTVLTSRDEGRGNKAVELLQEEGLKVVFHQLDVANSKSVEEFACWLSQTYAGIDILVNNAGLISIPGYGVDHSNRLEAAKTVLETNYYGVKRMIEAMVPIMKPGARIVNVSSKAGDLDYLKNEWKARLEDVSSLTRDAIDEFLMEYLQAVDMGEIATKGWAVMEDVSIVHPEDLSDYSASKIAVNAYSRIVDREFSAKAKGCFINCMCPGGTSTSMTGFFGHPVEVGADTAVCLALTPCSESPSGKFFTGREDVGYSAMPLFFNGELISISESYSAILAWMEKHPTSYKNDNKVQ